MTYEEFVSKIKDADIVLCDGYVPDQIMDTLPKNTFYIYCSWVIGGMFGGDCYGTVARKVIIPNPEPEFDSLVSILELVAPNVTFIQYKNICKNIVEYGEYSDMEYYGNFTEYRFKYVRLDSLYKILNEKGLLI